MVVLIPSPINDAYIPSGKAFLSSCIWVGSWLAGSLTNQIPGGSGIFNLALPSWSGHLCSCLINTLVSMFLGTDVAASFSHSSDAVWVIGA